MNIPIRYYPAVFAATLLGAGVFAWLLGYAQEDAYISFRYAENLLNGHGLTYNPGEAPVEGYTNFLWVLWAAFLGLVTDDFPVWVRFSGVVVWLANLWLVHRIANRHLSWLVGLFGVVVLGFNAVLASSVATGLETPLAALWVTLGLYYWLEEFRGEKIQPMRPFKWSLVAVAAVLTRPDLALPFGIMGLFWSLDWIIKGQLKRLMVWLPAILLVFAYLCWKWWYFGDLLPNTFYAKWGGSLLDGLLLIFLFVVSLGFVPLFWPKRRNWWTLALVYGTWLGYWAWMGGDYMGFRVLLPLSSVGFFMAFISIQMLWLKGNGFRKWSSFLGLWMVLGVFISHFWPGWWQNSQRIQFRSEMRADAEGPEGLLEYGNALIVAFGQDTSLRMATGAVGIVPFFTHYHTLDMMGLTDREVARNYRNTANLAGHGRFADADWVESKGAHIVVGRWIEKKDQLEGQAIFDTLLPLQLTLPGFQAARGKEMNPTVLWLDLPSCEFALGVIYLKRHPAIEEALGDPESKGILAISPILVGESLMP